MFLRALCLVLSQFLLYLNRNFIKFGFRLGASGTSVSRVITTFFSSRHADSHRHCQSARTFIKFWALGASESTISRIFTTSSSGDADSQRYYQSARNFIRFGAFGISWSTVSRIDTTSSTSRYADSQRYCQSARNFIKFGLGLRASGSTVSRIFRTSSSF